MKVFLYRMYSTTLSRYFVQCIWLLKADFIMAILLRWAMWTMNLLFILLGHFLSWFFNNNGNQHFSNTLASGYWAGLNIIIMILFSVLLFIMILTWFSGALSSCKIKSLCGECWATTGHSSLSMVSVHSSVYREYLSDIPLIIRLTLACRTGPTHYGIHSFPVLCPIKTQLFVQWSLYI